MNYNNMDHDVNNVSESITQGFGSAIFFADPDPGKNLHADPDPRGIRGRGLGVKGKNDYFWFFFMFQMILNNLQKNLII